MCCVKEVINYCTIVSQKYRCEFTVKCINVIKKNVFEVIE